MKTSESYQWENEKNFQSPHKRASSYYMPSRRRCSICKNRWKIPRVESSVRQMKQTLKHPINQRWVCIFLPFSIHHRSFRPVFVYLLHSNSRLSRWYAWKVCSVERIRNKMHARDMFILPIKYYTVYSSSLHGEITSTIWNMTEIMRRKE